MGVANSVWTARHPSSRRSGVAVGVVAAIVVTATVVVVVGFLAVDGQVPGVPSLTLPGSGGATAPVVVPDEADVTGSDGPDAPGLPANADPDVPEAAADPGDGYSVADGDSGVEPAAEDDASAELAAEDDASAEPADAPEDGNDGSAEAADGHTDGDDTDGDDTDGDGTDDPDPDDADDDAASADDEPSLEELQQRLVELGYLIGPVDGRRGPQTVAAIRAFQQVHGLAVDGVIGPRTLEAFAGAPVEPTLAGGPDTRIEVDLDAQLLHVVEAGERLVTLHVSSGNGRTYRSASGGTARARTPVGDFEVLRTVDGVRRSRLGVLYDPLYFYGGFAIHGSNSVPPYPASHGCVRITRADARWLIARVDVGTPVQVYGGEHVFAPSR